MKELSATSNHWAMFALGVVAATLPAILLWLLRNLIDNVRRQYQNWRPRKNSTLNRRIAASAGIIGSPLLLSIRLPGSWVLMWRSRATQASLPDQRRLAKALRETFEALNDTERGGE